MITDGGILRRAGDCKLDRWPKTSIREKLRNFTPSCTASASRHYRQAPGHAGTRVRTLRGR
jgi:hypothetical protein